MLSEHFIYFTNRYGAGYENAQIRIGLDTSGNIRSFVRLYYNKHDELEEDENGNWIVSPTGGVQEPDTSEDSLRRFLTDLSEEDSWYHRSDADQFASLALYSPRLDVSRNQFRSGIRLPNK
jgi:hypothetical protein